CRASMVVDEAQRHEIRREQRVQSVGCAELRAPFAVCDRDRHARTLHAGEEQRRRLGDLDHAQAPFELLGAVANATRPAGRAWTGLAQRRHHLTAIADAERERIRARKKTAELIAKLSIE